MRLTLCFYQGPFPDHVHHEPAQGFPIASATFVPVLKKSKPQKKKAETIWAHMTEVCSVTACLPDVQLIKHKLSGQK